MSRKTIDCDTHLGLHPHSSGVTTTMEQLIEIMDQAEVSMATSWPNFPYDPNYLEDNNRYVYESTLKYPDRIIGFGWVEPKFGLKKALDLTKRCMEEYGLRGVKMNAANFGLRYDDLELVAPVVEEVAKHNGVMVLHTAVNAIEGSHPFRTRKMAKLYPETPMWLVHIGGWSFGEDFSDACAEVALECPNISLLGSDIKNQSIVKVIKKVGSTRVMFASDAPYNYMHVEKDRYEALLRHELTEEEIDNVMYKNVAGVLNLSL
jgi:predicted TIM-barrel fold metal-dependent hydrolase